MARGTQSKEKITSAILKVFPGSFIDADGKTIRIPTSIEGEPIEVKVALTAAKDVLGGAVSIQSGAVQPQNRELTQEEIEEVRKLIEELQL